MSNNLLNVVEEAVKNHIETNNRKLYQFEKNKLYGYLGTALVSQLKKYKCFIAGGAITSLFTGAPINDLDIYFRNEESCIKFVEDSWEDHDDWINMLTKKSILMRQDNKLIQVIHFNFFKSAQEIFDSFDFTTEQFILHEEFLKHNSQSLIKILHFLLYRYCESINTTTKLTLFQNQIPTYCDEVHGSEY
ncbi:hypothetical protein [Paenibacillus elgii]|uniref:hypothetical protein n=1 Tax=Paenibacillus elgii TaxID=189691 RepID=UPI00203C371A|nr:hypothetical protein [Paenibacillus elgii]MCM3273764.1 hypothetical protein [Paenibacillus elgii]